MQPSIDLTDPTVISSFTRDDFMIYRQKRRKGELEANYIPTNATGATIGSTVTISHKVSVEPLITATGTTNGLTTTIACEKSVGPSNIATVDQQQQSVSSRLLKLQPLWPKLRWDQ